MLIAGRRRCDWAIFTGQDVAVTLAGGKLSLDFGLAVIEFVVRQQQCDQSSRREEVNPEPRRIAYWLDNPHVISSVFRD